ncbi:MAG UNVERIFIED_CONTAM: hypothetical protein LVT10_16200 [Anaerolineae bacterium]
MPIAWGRFAQINPQGFYDADAFTADALPRMTHSRYCYCGDSFTFGAAAEMGQSFAERLEADLAQRTPLTVWNTGIPAPAPTTRSSKPSVSSRSCNPMW